MSTKRYDLITEGDARMLDVGTTVTLAKGGHVTPLALDTLRARRVTLLQDGQVGDEAGLAPVADVRRVAVASDHTGVALRRHLVAHLRGRGLAITEIGPDGPDPVDYPDVAAQAARLVARGEADAAIVIDSAGLGSCMAANKIDGVRAAMCSDRMLARYAREHNGAHVLTLGATLLTPESALAIVDTFLGTPMTEPRYIRRLAKIRGLEQTR
jgi:ribose 5-phosphate isomerase B